MADAPPTADLQLKPCPFCGGEAAYEEVEERAVSDPAAVRFSVGCGNEDCIGFQSMASFPRRADAIAAWNRRGAPIADLMAHILCLHCRGLFTEEETRGKWGCPRCGNQGVPADTRRQGAATLTEHEWRILTIFASNWAEQCDRSKDPPKSSSVTTVEAISREIQRQLPDFGPFSMREEFQNLANYVKGPVEVSRGGETETIEPEKKQ